jgi:prolyl oligopeptidase
MQLTKPNTWRDLIACVEYLIQHKYTSPQRLAVFGASAGGIAVGRFLTERPDLVAAVVDAYGVSNPLRFEFSPSGSSQISEFGSVKSQAGFEDLYAMDSYQHVRDGVRYPAVLLITGWNDPRVDSWQPGKMAARLQSATTSLRPILLSVHYNGGHGPGGLTKEQSEIAQADEMSFLLWQFGMPEFQPIKK